MKKTLFVGLMLFLVCSTFGQKAVSELKASHAAELQKYLSTHKDLGFLQEHVIDDETLADMRKEVRANMKPYYLVGDFNRDKYEDFAVILTRGTAQPVFGSTEEAEARKNDVSLVRVVFNGNRKGFTIAHTENIDAPLTFNLSSEKKPKLYFGVFRSDADTFILAPAGRGYIVEYDKAP